MNTPFTPHDGPFLASTAPGSASDPANAADRTIVAAKPGARRANEFRDHIRAHRGGPFGPGGPGFGPASAVASAAAASASDPAPAADVGGPGPRGGGRGKRGDVRAAILKLLADRPMHGYEMIQEIAERSSGLWKPSPGSVYPTLQLLEDEGLIVAARVEGSKKLFELTDDGKAAAEKIETAAVDRDHRGRRPRAGGPAQRGGPTLRCDRASRRTPPRPISSSASSTSSTTPAARSTRSSARADRDLWSLAGAERR